jgi:hypothetical protein
MPRWGKGVGVAPLVLNFATRCKGFSEQTSTNKEHSKMILPLPTMYGTIPLLCSFLFISGLLNKSKPGSSVGIATG